MVEGVGHHVLERVLHIHVQMLTASRNRNQTNYMKEVTMNGVCVFCPVHLALDDDLYLVGSHRSVRCTAYDPAPKPPTSYADGKNAVFTINCKTRVGAGDEHLHCSKRR
jgi:hypothetical protein